jgi:gliding motility-associated-like protein
MPVYVQPDDPLGTPTLLSIDDRYSGVVNIGFPFPFYGTIYNDLIVSTNGVVSFDISKANAFAHYVVNANLPSGSYDRALIMGPYHDLDPSVNSSPNQRIQYQTFGTAPHRRWILSFYKVPLYNCNSAIENTHQIILYESTGIIEVTIFSKEICLTSQSGKAIVGLQDFSRTRGIMAPGRAQSDPPWGTIGMNESWRFVPSGGPSLFKRVELYDLAGNLLSTGTTSNLANGNLLASFPNTCPAQAGVTTYVVKSVYEKIDNPLVEIYGTDTVNVTLSASQLANVSATGTSCAQSANGTITVSPTNGAAPYTFKLDAGTPQSGPAPFTFINVTAGAHTVVVTDANGCTSAPLPVTVPAGPDLVANATAQATTCSGASNGTITVTVPTGNPPFSFVLDGGPPQTGNVPFVFTNVSAGPHTVTVSDAGGCTATPVNVTVDAGPALTTTVNKTDVICNAGATGTITVVQPSIGSAPFEYSLDGTNWQTTNTFTGLIAGSYTVFYREANGCQGSQQVIIDQPAALTATSSTTAVICFGDSNGTIVINPAGGIPPYQFSIDAGTNWQSNPVFNVPAGSYTIVIRDANNCTTTKTETVTQPSQLTASSLNSDASCNGGNDGTITVTANGGNAGYQYSIDGVNFQSSAVFNVAPGNYTVTVKDNLNCTTSFAAIIGLSVDLTLTQQIDPAICEGSSVQLQVVSNANQYVWTPATGLSNPGISNPVANPATTTQYIVNVTLGRCTASDTLTVNVNTAPVPDAGAPGFICYGQTYQLQGSGGTSFVWTPAGDLNNPSISNPVATPPKTTTYTLSVTDANGCPSLVTDDVIVDVTPPIVVKTFPFDTVVYSGEQFQVQAISNGTIFNWTPVNGLSDANIASPVITAGAVGDNVVYRVGVSTPAGCKGEGFVRVRVYKGPDLYIPTAFTPNNDGKNDKFFPFPVGVKQINYFKVFNRWGQMLFSTSALHDGWDGRFGGAEQPTGVYVWMAEGVTKDNKIITKQGTVTLIR